MAMTEEEKEAWRKKHNEELQSRTKSAKKQQVALARAERAEQVRKMSTNHKARIADKDEVAAYYSEVMRDDTASYSERTSAARELQRLQGWEKTQISDGAGDIAAFFSQLLASTSNKKAVWQRNSSLPDPNVVDLPTSHPSFGGIQNHKQ